MKVVKEMRKCVQCGRNQLWFNYSIVFGKSDNDSYLRRICKMCEGESGGTFTKEVRQFEREVQRLLKKKLQLEGHLRDNEEHLKVALKCLKTAQNVPLKIDRSQNDHISESGGDQLLGGVLQVLLTEGEGEEVQGEE
jgi:hypothetical protein